MWFLFISYRNSSLFQNKNRSKKFESFIQNIEISDIALNSDSKHPPSPIEFSTTPPTGDHVKKPFRYKGMVATI